MPIKISELYIDNPVTTIDGTELIEIVDSTGTSGAGTLETIKNHIAPLETTAYYYGTVSGGTLTMQHSFGVTSVTRTTTGTFTVVLPNQGTAYYWIDWGYGDNPADIAPDCRISGAPTATGFTMVTSYVGVGLKDPLSLWFSIKRVPV